MMAFCGGTVWGQLPPGWSNMDIDTSGGSANESNGTWTIVGDGADIWYTSDEFHYAYFPLSGDGFIEARVLEPGFTGGSDEWSKAGVMIRESTEANSKHVYMAVNRNTGASHFMALQGRPNTGDESFSTHSGSTQPYPVWVRLTRAGNTFKGEYSFENGVTWVTHGTTNVSMAADVLLGLAVTSHEDGTTTTVKFDNVNYTGSGENVRPQINAGPDITLTYPTNSVTLNGTVKDDGLPLPENPAAPDTNDPNKLRWNWSVVSVPPDSNGIVWSGSPNSGEAFTYEGSPSPPGTVFTCDPNATFDVPGLYVFNFSADDGEKNAIDVVNVIVWPTGYREKGYLYLSPVPGAEYVSPQTRYFLVRFMAISPYDLTNLSTFITVAGEVSGAHPGQTRIATDNNTVIFEVSSGFSNDELVTVTLIPTVDPGAPGVVEPYQYQFMVTGPMPPPPPPPPPPASSGSAAREQVVNTQATPDTECKTLPIADMAMMAEDTVSVAAADGPMIMPNGVSVPSDFPEVVITVNNNPSTGYIFLAYPHGGANRYVLMLDNSGYPVWYRRVGPGDSTLWNEFKVQKNGMITMGMFIGYDRNFNWIRNYDAGNGYVTNHHDLEVLEDDGYLIIAGRNNTVDMTRYVPGANPNANVHETILQEYTAAGELIFQFRSWDNFDIRDVEALVENPLGGNIRFPHINAIDVDDDGHLLISSRHISEITKINRDSGEMIWRLCGSDPVRSDFTFVNDPLNGFSSQHDISVLGNGRYMLFDNGNGHSPRVSRAVEYELDLNAMTATLVWEFRDTPDKYSHYMGNAQRLPNGNTLINFVMAGYPKAIEVDPNGVKRFEMNLLPGSDLYRAFRFPWDGMVEVPYLVVESPPDNLTLIFNKFGDPNVAYYRIYGGTTPQPTNMLDTSTSTLKQISEGLENGLRYYFRVTAVDIHGTESDYSNEESAVVSFTEPGQNVVLNGDFCWGKDSWIWDVSGSASAQWNIEGGVSHFDIAAGGTQISNVQLRQAGIRLVRGKEYLFEFDAWSATQPRLIEAKVGQDESPWTNYSKIGYSEITPNPKHFSYPFTMQDPSDYNARVVFNAGTSDIDVYIDNVSLFAVLPGDFDYDGCVRFDDLAVLTGEWLDEGSGLIADLQDNGKVDFNDFAIFADSFEYPCSTTPVTEKDAKRVLVPTSNIGYNWIGNAEPYNDTAWVQIAASDCPSGVGYENSPGDPVNYTDLIAHDVGAQMFGIMNSCYIRIPFALNIDPNELSSITLKIRYDDGFVAYINGKELTRDNFNATIPDWNDNADYSHGDNDARLLQPFRVNRVDNPDVFNALQPGDNILAIHGMNVSTGSSDFLISDELLAAN